MPQLGETVTEGTVGRWLKKVGDPVAKYEPLLEVETDKVASEIPSPFAGVLSEIFAAEGETVAVGAPVGEIALSAAPGVAGPKSDVDAGRPLVAPQPAASATAGSRRFDGALPTSSDGIRYSPAVRKLARQHRVDLQGVRGSGRGGRVTARDVAAFAQSGDAAAAQATAGQQPVASTASSAGAARPSTAIQDVPVSPPGSDDTVVRLTPIRKTIAERMVFSRSTIPFAWSMVEADITDVVRWRAAEKDAFKAREGVNLTYLPVVIASVCGALREFPAVNSSWAGDHIIVRKHVNVGVAVDAEEGLVVPVLRDADRFSLAGLAQAVSELAEKARKRRLTMDDLADGTITVNNTGALGSVASVPIINPPQAAIVTMEAVVKRPWVVNDALAIRSIMNLCLCFDHRVFDGGMASRFLQSVKRRLENFSSQPS
ncbi:MAG: 2-oxo acid dehydrogenase subunit E2 [Candidatus Eremiobacteraeota bacterium]|nr:2-oxo acid dehydrogenase subunit E2 [Candidatus Eremiobacteraeota bacterium]MBC5826219.1 2-oxo acid dehydrogenase subunit E2 [Candidatus Eremiobacteraeota bacterium]